MWSLLTSVQLVGQELGQGSSAAGWLKPLEQAKWAMNSPLGHLLIPQSDHSSNTQASACCKLLFPPDNASVRQEPGAQRR